jgi:hypothetical protein
MQRKRSKRPFSLLLRLSDRAERTGVLLATDGVNEKKPIPYRAKKSKCCVPLRRWLSRH